MSAAHEPRTEDAGKHPGKTSSPRRAGAAQWPAWLGLVLAVAALVLIIAAGLMLRTLEQHQTAAFAAFDNRLQSLGQRLDALEKSAAPKSGLDTAISNTQQSLKDFGDRLDSMDAALTELRRRSEGGRDSWIKAEAAALLMAANEQVQLNANPVLALRALQAADERLRLLSDPRLIPVRQEIAREETALRGVPQIDVEGMSLTLASLAESVDKLPLKRSAPEHYTPGAHALAAAVPPTLWTKLKTAVTQLFRNLFTIHHRNTPLEPLLAPKEEFFLRENLGLRLDAARIALLDRDSVAFQNSAQLARRWLLQYFNQQDGAVKAGGDALARMEHQQINPPLPDISASLTLLRRLESPRKGAP